MDWIRDRALTLVLMAMFLVALAGQVLTGLARYNATQADHGQAPVDVSGYLATGHPWEALFENWESEFLQMAVFVLLTTFLYRGIPGVAAPRRTELADADPRDFATTRCAVAGQARRLGAPCLRALAGTGVRAAVPGVVGGAWPRRLCRVCGRSTGTRAWSATLTDYLTSARFWFESFQNWQSEFLAIASMVWLAVYLRQRWSPESKPVHAPHDETGR